MALLGAILSTQSIPRNNTTALTPATTISLDVTLSTLYTWTAGQNATVNATGSQVAGQIIVLRITNDATPRTITFGTGFLAASVLVGTISKSATIHFVSDGTSLFELGRATVL